MTNNHVRKRMLTIITISVICVFCFGYLKSTESEANEILAYDSIGNVIEAAANDLALINQEINGISAYGENDLFLTVNGIPLTKQELQLRKNLDGVSTNPRSEQELIEILIKEKVKFSLDREKGILPTEMRSNLICS